MATHLIPRTRPDGTTARFEFLDRVSLRARIAILAATVAAVVVVLVSAAAFFVVRANVLQTLDANLLQRATAAAQGGIDPRVLTQVPTQFVGAADIKLALLFSDSTFASVQGPASAPPLGGDELDVARGAESQSVRSASLGGVAYRVVAVPAGPGQALVIAQRLDPTQQVLTRLAITLPWSGPSVCCSRPSRAWRWRAPACARSTASPRPPSASPPPATCAPFPSTAPTSLPASPAVSTPCSVRSRRRRNSSAASWRTQAMSSAPR